MQPATTRSLGTGVDPPRAAGNRVIRRRYRGILPAIAALLGCGLGWYLLDRLLMDRRPIVVGILHARTGPTAVSETGLVDAEILALEEIDRAGGLLGRPVRWVIADGGSEWTTFARQAERLIRDDRVDVIFGCWTSESRKGVLPVVEAADHLLVYPMAHEGLEESPHIVYTGAAPNQQITPAVQWCHDSLRARRFFLVGSDSLALRCTNAIIADHLRGLNAELVGEASIPFASRDVAAAVQQIASARPDVILSSLAGDSALAFAKGLRAAGIRPEKVPVVAFAVGETDLANSSGVDMVGDYAAWNYFQSLERPENLAFVRAFKTAYGVDRTTSDPIAAAYNGVRLWAQAVREAGTADVRQVRTTLRHQSLAAPEGIIAVDPETRHTWRPVFIGRIRADGQFDVVWSSRAAIRPVPFPISRSRPEWERLEADLFRAWGGGGTNPAAPPAGARSDR